MVGVKVKNQTAGAGPAPAGFGIDFGFASGILASKRMSMKVGL
jgi:hypothetical protein